ncbi:MAG TPA: aminopeptidase, partial [Burkholderiales bacterium]|nr:aminopeptidase [Burkholderiales bacterium]
MRAFALIALIGAALAGGCSHFSYYMQSVEGQLSLLQSRQTITEILADPATPPPLKKRLELALSIRDYASAELK